MPVLDCREPLERIRKALHETDEQCGLRIGLRPALLPVFQRAHVRTQISCEQPSGDLEALSHAYHLSGSNLGSSLERDRVRSQGALALPRVRERRHAPRQFGKQIALARTNPPSSHLCHVDLLASSSALSISFSALRCFAVKSPAGRITSPASGSLINSSCNRPKASSPR